VLYTPENFEPLTNTPWDDRVVHEALRAVVADVDARLDERELWPAVEEWDTDGGRAALPLTTLYAGAAGVVLGLDLLVRRGHVTSRLDVAAAAERALEAWRDEPDAPERLEPPVRTHSSLFDGETGVLLVAHRLAPSTEVASDLHRRVVDNVDNETNELCSGSPGTMIAAKAMLDWTGDDRWANAWRESAEILWSRREPDGFWTYPPFGKAPGAAHGVGTNANVLLAGGDLFREEWREPLLDGTRKALAATAVVEEGVANWPVAAGDDLVAWDGQIRLQWCHGGAGVVASAAHYLGEELVLAAAELVWRAGPASMDKGPGICHGTAGNGYALLKTFERTGDELWLERARRFAVHALEQVERWRGRRGLGRYTLWTGDLGAAVFAADCLDARTAMPVLETWD
jgi:Lanthionine synthetase C-like protein